MMITKVPTKIIIGLRFTLLTKIALVERQLYHRLSTPTLPATNLHLQK
jgi:hypothetical protein